MRKSFICTAPDSLAALTAGFIASGGSITTCPTAIVGPTRAKLPHRWSATGIQAQAELDNANGLRE